MNSVTYLLQRQEAETDNEGSSPIDSHGNGGSSGSCILGEELSDEEPRDGTRTSGEHDHEEDDEEDGEVTDPLSSVLEEKTNEEEQHIDQHTTETSQHESLTAKLLHHDQRDEGHKYIHGAHSNGGIDGSFLTQTSIFVDGSREEDNLKKSIVLSKVIVQ